MKVCGTVTATSPGFHSGGDQGKAESVCAAVDCNRVFCLAEGGEGPLEILHHRAADKARGTQCLLKDRRQLLLKFDVGCN